MLMFLLINNFTYHLKLMIEDNNLNKNIVNVLSYAIISNVLNFINKV